MGCIIACLATYCLYILNTFTFICGILLLALGIVLGKFENFHLEAFKNLSISNMAIAVGVLMLLMSILGCVVTIIGTKYLLGLYAAVLIILLILQIALAVLAFLSVKNDVLSKKVAEYVAKEYEQCVNEENVAAIKSVNDLQQSLSCCGYDGPDDFRKWKTKIPTSCCNNSGNNKDKNCLKPFEKGCFNALKEELATNFIVIGGVAIGLAIIEFVGAILALFARSSILP